MSKYYLTTPIYYVNAAPHIGHTFTTIVADTIKRVKAMQGVEAYLVTGTDEHGQKIERAATKIGKSPQEYTDLISAEFQRSWDELGLKYDKFQRTTSPQHAAAVVKLFDACEQNGHIYRGSYTGYYSVVNEAFVPDAKPGDVDPETGQPLELLTEENLFFKLSAFQDQIIALHEQNPEFLQPEARRNEILSFLKNEKLQDLSISRTSIKWGIPVPKYPGHVFYVWFDALMTYWSAVEGQDLWPADLHLMSKEIVRFHAIYWPAFLLAAGWPLPKKIFSHGWLLFEDNKMSKSRGNIVRATPIQKVMGIDALRYFLLREIPFGADGSFSYDALVARYNSDLANGLGNLVSRTLSMIKQYRDGKVPAPVDGDDSTVATVMAQYENFEFHKALESIWRWIGDLDKYIVENAPWKLAKDSSPEAQARLDEVLYKLFESLRLINLLAAPVIPESAERIQVQLNLAGPLVWGHTPAGHPIGEIAPIFPRLDAKVAIDRMKELEVEELARQNALLGKHAEEAPQAPIAPIAETISIDDFVKVDLRVGKVLSAEPVKGADKLLHLKVDIGEASGPRTIVAGIAKAYQPEKLIDRKVVIVANLAPRKLKGIESQGMIVAASLEGGSPVLAAFLEEVPVGARLK
ncbi:methionine--tRNA ligase [Bryobacter aggregatus]|uniref:methionine--tRNA ligase n=1 Tax=Bryobacter aggregatus TaxID=360054 RepID=UPI0004E1197A|nr:methionine--tRNA ligase [Bryobacter aggregatus]